MSIIGIKLMECNFTASCAKIVRKYRDVSISDIKKIIMNNDYLLCCDYIDADGIKEILNLHKDLEVQNISSVIYEHGEVASVKFLENLINSYEETAKQVEYHMDNEVLSENFE